MKFILVLILGITLHAEAANVLKARLDTAKENILIDVVYGGGCKVHTFYLKLDKHCLETYPVQCSAKLVEEIEDGVDTCEAIIYDTAVINIEKAGLSDPYFNGASITIHGDRAFTGQETSVVVQLPWKKI